MSSVHLWDSGYSSVVQCFLRMSKCLGLVPFIGAFPKEGGSWRVGLLFGPGSLSSSKIFTNVGERTPGKMNRKCSLYHSGICTVAHPRRKANWRFCQLAGTFLEWVTLPEESKTRVRTSPRAGSVQNVKSNLLSLILEPHIFRLSTTFPRNLCDKTFLVTSPGWQVPGRKLVFSTSSRHHVETSLRSCI